MAAGVVIGTSWERGHACTSHTSTLASECMHACARIELSPVAHTHPVPLAHLQRRHLRHELGQQGGLLQHDELRELRDEGRLHSVCVCVSVFAWAGELRVCTPSVPAAPHACPTSQPYMLTPRRASTFWLASVLRLASLSKPIAVSRVADAMPPAVGQQQPG